MVPFELSLSAFADTSALDFLSLGFIDDLDPSLSAFAETSALDFLSLGFMVPFELSLSAFADTSALDFLSLGFISLGSAELLIDFFDVLLVGFFDDAALVELSFLLSP